MGEEYTDNWFSYSAIYFSFDSQINETIATVNSTQIPNTPDFNKEDDTEDYKDSSLWTRDETTLTAELASLLRQKDNDTSKLHGATMVQNLSRYKLIIHHQWIIVEIKHFTSTLLEIIFSLLTLTNHDILQHCT